MMLVVAFILSINVSEAADPPVVGIWEQMVVVTSHSSNAPVRRNFLFVDRKIASDIAFSALFYALYDGAMCCLKIKNLTSLTF